MRFGVTLSHTHTAIWPEVTQTADELGLESVWLPDHLVLPLDMAGSPYADGGQPPISADTPLYDAPAYLSFLAGQTSRVLLGTFVYLLGLRHPLITARAFTTTDLLAQGRLRVGVGAGWLESEWLAAGIDPASRGGRLDEAMTVIRRLWRDDVIEHRGQYWSWQAVRFEPKSSPNGPPLLVGGESRRALRRAATLGDGWMSMPHPDLASLRPQLAALEAERIAAGRHDDPFEVTACILDPPPPEEIRAWERAGVHRMIVKPWKRTRDTITELERFITTYADVTDP